MAFPKAYDHANSAALQQGFAVGEMGFSGQFAQQQSETAHVRFGSKADIARCQVDVRFTSESGRR